MGKTLTRAVATAIALALGSGASVAIVREQVDSSGVATPDIAGYLPPEITEQEGVDGTSADLVGVERLRDLADGIARARALGGFEISWAGAKSDGSGIELGVIDAHEAAHSPLFWQDVEAIVGAEVPVELVPAERAVPADSAR